MKKVFTLAAMALFLFAFTACGGEDEEETRVGKKIDDVIATTVVGDKVFHMADCDVFFDINYTNRKVDLTLTDITFAPMMPKVQFKLEQVAVTSITGHIVAFSGTGLVPMEGYTVNDLSGTLDLELGTMLITCSIATSRGTYDVTLHNELIYSQLPSGADYENYTDKYYKFETDESDILENVYINNVQFVSAMPKLKEIRIPLKDATKSATASEYIATATEIIPYYKTGNTEVAMAERTITNLKVAVNVRAKQFTIEFDCYGLHYTDSGKLYF